MKSFFVFAFILMAVVVAVGAYAQTPTPSTAYQLPNVFVTAVTLGPDSFQNEVKGTMTVENRDTTVVSDLHYQLQLLGVLPPLEPGQLRSDTAPEYDRFVSPETFTLLPGEKKTIPFTYQVPRLPADTYRLRARIVTSQARRLGWHDVTLQTGQADIAFGLLTSRAVILPGNTEAAPEAGPNVVPGSTLSVETIVENKGKTALTAPSKLTLYRWDSMHEKVNEQVGPAVTIPAGGTSTLTLPITAPTIPDAYEAVVHLQDGEGNRISSQAHFRLVVVGVSGKVVSADFEKIAFQSGQSAVITAGVVGPADRQTSVEATVTVDLKDGETVVASQDTTTTLGAGVQTLSATFSLPRDLNQPALRVTLKDTAGTVLDVFETTPTVPATERASVTPLTPATWPTWAKPALIGGGVVVALAAILTAVRLRRRQPKLMTPLVLLAALCLTGVASIYFTTKASANGIVISHIESAPGSSVTFFINSPMHEGKYFDNKLVPVTAEFTYAACNNSALDANFSLWHPSPPAMGGKYTSNFPFHGKVALSTDVHLSGNQSCPAGRTCYRSGILEGMVELRENGRIPYQNTTFKFDGFRWVAGYLDAETRVVFLNFVPPTQCSDGIDNPDPEDTVADIADPGCHTDNNASNVKSYDANDNDETDPPPSEPVGQTQCNDGVDNIDGEDLLADTKDPGCHTDGNANNPASYTPQDDDEADTPTNPTQIVCQPQQPTQIVGQPVVVNALLNGQAASGTWNADGGTPQTGTGSSFTTTFATTGDKFITIKTDANGSNLCWVKITTGTTTPTPTTTPTVTPTPTATPFPTPIPTATPTPTGTLGPIREID